MKLKYIRLNDDLETFIVFPIIKTHVEIADVHGIKKDEVPSAGFLHFYEDSNKPFGIGVECYGRSDSLGVDSRPIDSSDAELMFGLR